MTKLLPLAIISTFLFFISCEKEPAKVISINPTEFSEADQIKIGNTFKNTIEQSSGQFNILDKTAYGPAYNYVEKLFSTMLNTAQVERRLIYDWTVHIVQDDSIKTLFFLPGGHLYIYTGLLKYIESESQLLELIGHEIYYADTDLLVLKMREKFDGKTMGDILLGKEVPQIDELAAAMPSLKFEEEQVVLADSFAVAMICPFLYEPLGIVQIIEKAEREAVSLEWLEAKSAPAELRKSSLERHAMPCGLNGVTNEDDYQKFKSEYLP